VKAWLSLTWKKLPRALAVLALGCSCATAQSTADKPNSAPREWHFAVSGDSRNCGDVIVPAIAAGANKNGAAFYWHLGDLRATTAPDEDYMHEPEHRQSPPDKLTYSKTEWDDFIQAQLNPFGSTPVFLGIGNHETYAPMSREKFIIHFADWLDSPVLRAQRLADNPNDHALKAHFHWIQNGVDFIYLDNATQDQFDAHQLAWFEGVLQRATGSGEIKTVVVGMHAALPDSLASGHSMNDWPIGAESGRRVYKDLLRFKTETGKHVYILASHSHFFMSGIFATEHWRSESGVLPGWIIGTAGAMRYALPAAASQAKEARQMIYGYLLGTARDDGSIDFAFQEIKRGDIPDSVVGRYTAEFVDYCFTDNADPKIVSDVADSETEKK
jgi:hypothetical protein